MALLMQVILAAGAACASLLVARDAANFEVVEGMLSVMLATGAIILAALVSRD